MDGEKKAMHRSQSRNDRYLVTIALCLSTMAVILAVATGITVYSIKQKQMEFESKLTRMANRKNLRYEDQRGELKNGLSSAAHSTKLEKERATGGQYGGSQARQKRNIDAAVLDTDTLNRILMNASNATWPCVDNKPVLCMRGPPGHKGDPGPTGPSGRQGPPGIHMGSFDGQQLKGEQGPPGPPGQPGWPGPTGPRGKRGWKGDVGRKGFIGRPGIPGRPGQDGSPGMPGLDGKVGYPGERGLPGMIGYPGAKGEPGIPGLRGEFGPPGSRGPAGFPGPMGRPGQVSTGKPGIKGLDGIRGPRGPQGLQGPPGPPGSSHKSCKLKPVVIGLPGNVSAVEGLTARLTCQVFGYPKPKITWRINGALLNQKDKNFKMTEHSSSAYGSTLEVRSVNQDHDGKIECQAVNINGMDKRQAILKVIPSNQFKYVVPMRSGHRTLALDWESGRKWCKFLGGDLASIKSSEEQALIQTAVNRVRSMQSFWIGANDMKEEGSFEWSDGTEFLYTKWDKENPNDGTTQWPEDCVQLGQNVSRHWDVENCHFEKAFVCKVPLKLK